MSNDKSRLYIKILLIFTAVILVIVTLALFVFPSLYENDCKTRVNKELEAKLTYDVQSSNICVIRRQSKITGDTEQLTFSAGASGVIFEKQAGTYYAVTAYHVVSDADENTKFLIQPSFIPPYSETTDTVAEYYKQFPPAKIEYYDKEYDLAVLSFHSGEKLGILNIAESNAEKDTEIAVISNPEGERFVHTFGSIISNDMTYFSGNDGAESNFIIKHNAYIAPGSSGSAVLSFSDENNNGNAEIVGINIGGAADFMGRFSYGAMIPCQHVRSFLNNWKAVRYNEG